MYGLRPNARIEKFANVPPENTSKRERSGLPKNKAVKVLRSIPAAGICAANLYTTNIPAVTKIFFLTEGV